MRRSKKRSPIWQSLLVWAWAWVVLSPGVADERAEADRCFEKKDYLQARNLYGPLREKSRDPRNPEDWMKITTRIVQCCVALGETEQAAEEYFLLCRVDPLAPLDDIPLPWFVPTVKSAGGSPREKSAETWLDPLQTRIQSPGGTLLAAGILSVSTDGAKRLRGLDLLRNQSTWVESDPAPDDREAALRRQAGLLAGALLWKQKIPTLRNRDDLLPLQRSMQQIPESLRSGPLFLFGRAAARVGEHEEAVLAFMRLPILYPENRPLAAEALREAALSLEKLGRSDQATSLKREAERLSER